MRVLLDEHIPVELAAALHGHHHVDTVVGRTWAGLKNGDLLQRMRGEYDALVTMDRSLQFQGNPRHFRSASFSSVPHPTGWYISYRSCREYLKPSRASGQGRSAA